MLAPPLQIIDNILLTFNVGDVLIGVVLLGMLGTLFRRSGKLFSLHLITFGLLFVVLPAGMLETQAASLLPSAEMYKFFGLGLLLLAPIVYSFVRR